MSAPLKKVGGAVSSALKAIFLLLIRFYQLCISPLLGANCRYRPTCRAYTFEAIQKYGPFKGTWMGMKRIARCRPGVPGGYDPVP